MRAIGPVELCTTRQSSIVSPSESTASTTGVQSAGANGQRRSARSVDGQDERDEVRPAAQREARRLDLVLPGGAELPLLGGRDRAMLGAVQEERPSAHDPGEQRDRHGEPERRATAVPERKTKPIGARKTAVSTRRSAFPATPSRRRSGETDMPSRARPRASGMRRRNAAASASRPRGAIRRGSRTRNSARSR